MTVAELIAKLQDEDPSDTVVVVTYEGFDPVTEVEHDTGRVLLCL